MIRVNPPIDPLVFQDITQVSIARFVDFATAAYQDNPSVNLEVFAHKADTLSEEYRIGQSSDIKAPHSNLISLQTVSDTFNNVLQTSSWKSHSNMNRSR